MNRLKESCWQPKSLTARLNLLMAAKRGFILFGDGMPTGGAILGPPGLVDEIQLKKCNEGGEILGFFCAIQKGGPNPVLPALDT